MFDGNFRTGVEARVAPLGEALKRTGISPDHITIVGVIMSGAAAVVIGSGRLFLGAILLALTGIPDLLDGAVAKAAGTATARGAFFDSVADRLTDAMLFGGVAWYLFDAEPGSRIALLPMAILGVSLLVSYQRAKAESLGFDAKGGLMERAERFIVLGFGLVFSSLLIPVLWFLFVATAGTAIFRFQKVWRQADPPPRVGRQPRPERLTRTRRRSARPKAQQWRDKSRARREAARTRNAKLRRRSD